MGQLKSQQEIEARKAAVVAAHGPWTDHDIDLGQGIFTRKDGKTQAWRFQQFDALLAEAGYGDLRGRRLLDLACHEGLFAIEYARRGAETLGIEGRPRNVAKAVFARDVLGLDNCVIVQDDVRNLSPDYGQFDIVICAGILYHLDFPDCITLLDKIKSVCRGVAIIDTHVAPLTDPAPPLGVSRFKEGMVTCKFRGRTYQGRPFREHAEDITAERKRDKALWASLDNNKAFWLTEASLRLALEQAGLTIRSWICEKGRKAQSRPLILVSAD